MPTPAKGETAAVLHLRLEGSEESAEVDAALERFAEAQRGGDGRGVVRRVFSLV